VFSWTPTEDQGPRTYTFNVFATDSATVPASTMRVVTITVGEVNRVPQVVAIAPQTVVQGGTLQALATATDPDLPRNTLTFLIDAGSPSGVAIAAVDAGSAAITWAVPSGLAPGVYLILVRVRDEGVPRLSASAVLTVTVVAAIPPPPVIDLGDTTPPIVLEAGGTLSRGGIATVGSTATVDYGDGSGVQPLAIAADGGFALGHVYSVGGLYSAIVPVANASGAVTVRTLAVDVIAPPLVTIVPGTVKTDKKKGTMIGLTFSGDVSAPGAASRATYRLFTAGKDKTFGTKDDKTIAIKTVAFSPSTRGVSLGIKKKLPTGTIKLTVRASSILDAIGREVDGNRDGQPGGDFAAILGKRSLTIASAFRASSRGRR